MISQYSAYAKAVACYRLRKLALLVVHVKTRAQVFLCQYIDLCMLFEFCIQKIGKKLKNYDQV